MDNRLVTKVRAQFAANPPSKIGVAVSGGGDSVALLHLLSVCFEGEDVELRVVTVDHGLRPEAAQEAEQVGQLAAKLGLVHNTLHWHDWDGLGNLQDQARRARYRLLANWCEQNDIRTLALGHTADDQAETVLMRLARGAGVSGLSAMQPERQIGSVTVLRPVLAVSRAELRQFLSEQGVCWVEDPTNHDLRYDRIKARQALTSLTELGLTDASLSMVARNMRQAREALNWHAHEVAQKITSFDAGDVLFDANGFENLPFETRRRLLVTAILWVTGADYAPRRASVEHVLEAIGQDRTGTVGGCQIVRHRGNLRICREFNAIRDLSTSVNNVWDKRWRVNGPEVTGADVRALGETGLKQCDNWRDTGRSRVSLLSSPALWIKEELIAAPLAGEGKKWRIELLNTQEGFFRSLLSH